MDGNQRVYCWYKTEYPKKINAGSNWLPCLYLTLRSTALSSGYLKTVLQKASKPTLTCRCKIYL